MLINILKSIIKNFQVFLLIWVIVLVANQLFFYRACFAPYCLISALPHTFVISALLTYFSDEDAVKDTTPNDKEKK